MYIVTEEETNQAQKHLSNFLRLPLCKHMHEPNHQPSELSVPDNS
jgi:hypothetical protein